MPFLNVTRPDEQTDHVADTVRFVHGYTKALGAHVEQLGTHQLRLELSRDQLCTLEGYAPNTWYASSSLPEWATMYWQLTPPDASAASTDRRYESAALGSRRLELMRRSAAAIGAATRLRMVPASSGAETTFRTIVIIGFEIAYLCHDVRHTLLPVAIDTVTGAADEGAAVSILSRSLDEIVPQRAVRQRRRLTYRQAFTVACDYVKRQLAGDEAVWNWYDTATKRYIAACDAMEGHCNACRAHGDMIPDGDIQRWHRELKQRYAPRIEATPTLTMAVFCPLAELPRQLL